MQSTVKSKETPHGRMNLLKAAGCKDPIPINWRQSEDPDGYVTTKPVLTAPKMTYIAGF